MGPGKEKRGRLKDESKDPLLGGLMQEETQRVPSANGAYDNSPQF